MRVVAVGSEEAEQAGLKTKDVDHPFTIGAESNAGDIGWVSDTGE
jgi:hypothetical protein